MHKDYFDRRLSVKADMSPVSGQDTDSNKVILSQINHLRRKAAGSSTCATLLERNLIMQKVGPT
jgi:hypothetical protein